MVYVYDGTFAGYLCAVAKAVSAARLPRSFSPQRDRQGDLFSPTETVETDEAVAREVLADMKRRISRTALRRALDAFLSEAKGVEMLLFRYLWVGRQLGKELDGRLTHEDVHAVHALAQRVRREAHRMKGLVRFRELDDGLLYADIEPNHNVLPLISPHFASRFPDQRWVIQDVKRRLWALSEGTSWALTDRPALERPVLGEDEAACQDLWRAYFEHIAIDERANPRLQKQKMPVRYWKFLVEMRVTT